MRKYKGLHVAANMAGTPGLGIIEWINPLCSPTDVSALTSDNGTERRIYKYISCESDRLEYSCWDSKFVESINLQLK
jgi:hypothetical protein